MRFIGKEAAALGLLICILLSSGVVLTIPFLTVLISRFSLSPASAESGKQSA